MAGGPALAEVNCTSAPQNTYPRMKVTVCWTGAATSYTFLGHSFGNGDSIIVCPNSYSKGTNYLITYVYNWERWNTVSPIIGGDTFDIEASTSTAFGGFTDAIFIRDNGNWKFRQTIYGSTTANVATPTPSNSNISYLAVGNNQQLRGGSITQNWFHSLKTVSLGAQGNITVKWEPISGAGEPWAQWKDAGLSFVTTSTNAACTA
jgi:hypothetical protein